MKAKIFLVVFTSYTESDNYLFNDVRTYTDEKEARKEFDVSCENAYKECQWGSAWDSIETMDEEELEDTYEYDVKEKRNGDYYSVSSDAYEGYQVEVRIDKVEIEIPQV